jgi:radical SAM modification target selenobiotic family peptide
MNSKDLKKLLAGLGVAGLISAGGVNVPGAHAAGSG